MEYLARYHYTPGAIANNIAHLHTFHRLAELPLAPLHHYRLQLALRAVAMNLRPQKVDRLPVTPAILKKVISHIRSHPDSPPIILGILLMFLGFLRQSSVAPSTVRGFDASGRYSVPTRPAGQD